jgi:hypothetical protein
LKTDGGHASLCPPYDLKSSLRANGSRECAPDDGLREAIHVNALMAPRSILGTMAYARASARENTTSIRVPECAPVLIWKWARLASTKALVRDRLTPALSEA